MNLELAVATAVTLTSGFISYLVIKANKKSVVNRTFAYFIIATIIWIISLYLSNHILPQALFWTRWTFLGAAFIALFLLYFALVFPKREKGFPLAIEILIFLPALIIIYLLSFTNLIIKGITYIATGTGVEQGSLYLAWPIYFLAFIISALAILIKKYKHAQSVLKAQLKFMLWGLGLALVIAVTTNLIFPLLFKNDALSNYGPYAVFIFVGLTAHAIITHELLEIRVFVTQFLVILISFLLLIETLLSKTFSAGVLRFILFVLASYGGYRLVLSVREEIKRRQEIQELTDQLKKANIRLKELDQLKSEFLSVASHELNSPMSIILGYLHMILYEGFGKVDKNARQYLQKVYFKAELLAKLVADLLNVSRIEQGRLKIEIKPVDLGSTLKDLCQDHAIQAKEKGLALTFHEPKPALPSILVDPDKLKEIIQNLLSNAVKFTKQGYVKVEARRQNSEVLVSVQDTGIGIPKDAQPHIFEKFYRVDNSLVREAGGTGLGLHLVKQYLELMHGKIWFESEGENKGTTFYFTLPVAK